MYDKRIEQKYNKSKLKNINIKVHLMKNYWKYLILLLTIFIIFFPREFGKLINLWYEQFSNSFLNLKK